ncbi:MAG: SNF2 helicase associated domain-containing protein [Oscillospiraceae bacterium]|nr:SNF2 helicase associated domain-containing protein [Oscillospiraceae bacterium]
MIKRICSPTIYKRGLEYFNEGRVHLRKREENLITAVVDGEELYNVNVKLSEKAVDECFCTCPYFETMNTACKHIVAALKQRLKELEEGADFVDENDRLAKRLCDDFVAKRNERSELHAKFTLHITRKPRGGAVYGMSMTVNGIKLNGIENFLESYLAGTEFKFDRYTKYNPKDFRFPQYQDEIIRVLAETYENRAADAQLYMKAAYRTSFGSLAAKRIFPLLRYVDYSIVFDSLTLGAVRIVDENPDIIIDVNALDGEIDMSVSDRGFALTRDGEWFFYENTIYHTDEEWRGYFMPIYNSLDIQGRTQISFKGDNSVLFATHVLPDIKDKHGVIARGIDELIISEKPVFDIYFDTIGTGITAAVIVNYGNLAIRLPSDSHKDGKIIVRDYEAENDILSSFASFANNNGTLSLYSDRDIYLFLSDEIPRLKPLANLHYSDRFRGLKISNKIEIRASVSYMQHIDLLETGFESNLTYEQINGILNAVKLKRSFYRMPGGSFIDLEKSAGRDVLNLLNQLDFTYEDLRNGSKTIPKYHALYLNSLTSVKKNNSFIKYIDEIKNKKPVIPSGLETVLRGYQKDGMEWLTQLSQLGFGGILADDMGLGKTLQVIAYIHGIKPEKPTLIVAPSALLYNWQNEINKFTPDASSIIVDGAKEDRHAVIENKIKDYEFVITSYPILRRDIALYQEMEFSYFIIDEAQHIKNPRTMSARSVKKINAEHKFALTGTPIENSLMELWSIFDFIMPGYLYSSHEFRARYELPLVKDGDRMTADSFRARIKPFMLRRMKSDVLQELPEKIENTMYAELTNEQRDMYMAYLSVAKGKAKELLSEGGQGRMRILSLIMRLRQICCHPMLFDENYDKESGKLNLLMELVKSAKDSGHRVLVFSQFTSMLKIIKETLRDSGIGYFYLDGQTPSEERAELSKRFNGGENDVFLISLKAGGVGLNLIGADTVIHYDPWWNPAVMDQASDRAYRIGQTKAVQVIRLASKGTIEERIMQLQESKRNLADDIVRVNTDTLSSLSDEDILSLFN